VLDKNLVSVEHIAWEIVKHHDGINSYNRSNELKPLLLLWFYIKYSCSFIKIFTFKIMYLKWLIYFSIYTY